MKNNNTTQMLCAWAGPGFVISFCAGIWLIGGFVPPHPPGWGEAEVLQFYRDQPFRIRAGLLITMFSATLWIPWTAVLATQMKRMGHHTLANAQLGCGIATSVFVILPIEVWMAASYRPERSGELLLFLNDFSYIMFVGLTGPAFFQILSIGIATILDKSGQQVFPRWVGFFNIWVASISLTGSLVLFFKSGPLAWNGAIAFWLPMVVYGIWYSIMFLILRSAIKKRDSNFIRVTSKSVRDNNG